MAQSLPITTGKWRRCRRQAPGQRRPATDSEEVIRMTYGHDAHTAGAEHAAHDHRPGFFTRWLFSTNHKDIGTLYICFAIFVSVIAGGLSVVMRAQLMHPYNELIANEQLYNVIITAHGLLMVFFVVMPATFGGF